mmetsp:Transcript_38673/g.122870  ORF Transcript_38673/g.122870 Transcript_38673/m.122870 type:complete len:226 (-) Transcript_38673:382-1059(-)
MNMIKSASGKELTMERHKQMVELAVRKLQHACGLEGLGVDAWVENVVSPYPGYHMEQAHIKQPALMMQPATGVSMNTLFAGGFDSLLNLALLVAKINSEDIRNIAIHDLLFSEGDRHDANVFVDETGKLTLIDNDQALGWSYRETVGGDCTKIYCTHQDRLHQDIYLEFTGILSTNLVSARNAPHILSAHVYLRVGAGSLPAIAMFMMSNNLPGPPARTPELDIC